jgi:hypothetical protein
MIKEALAKPVSKILGQAHRLIIPPFQRDYKWTPKQVKQLIQDVCDDVKWDGNTYNPYYVGAVVCCPIEGREETFEVLDGQQRLTTISIILATLRRILRHELNSPKDLNITSLLYSGSTNPLTKIELHEPSEKDGDQKVYRDILLTETKELNLEAANRTRKGRKGNSAAMKTSVYRAFKAAEKEILETISGSDLSVDKKIQRITLLADAFSGIKMISIVTESESDAFTLFETLNSRGLELNSAELIKNKLLQNAGRDSINHISDKWKTIERYCQKRTVDFLRTWYNSERRFVRKPDLYDKFSDMIGRPGRSSSLDVTKFCDELEFSSEIYGAIIEPSESTIYRGLVKIGQKTQVIQHLRFINNLGFVAMRPLLLSALAHRSEIALRIIQLAELVAVRNIGGNTNSLEKPYSSAAIILSDVDFDDDEALEESRKILMPCLPTLEKLQANLKDYSFNEKNARAILALIDQEIRKEESGRTKMAYNTKAPAELNLEHIFPLNPSASCVAEAGLQATRAEEEGITWRLGNLTLLEADLNQSIKNDAYSEKCKTYKKSELLTTKSLPASYQKWSEEVINNRTSDLAQYINKIWAIPGV